MLYRIYPNVSYYCNVTNKNVHFTLHYNIVDISILTPKFKSNFKHEKLLDNKNEYIDDI